MAPEPAVVFVHRGTRAVQRMVEHAPSTGGLALWVRHEDSAAEGPVPAAPAWTDGHTVFYAPAFEQLPLPRQAGWVAHEVLHIALRHAARYLALQARLGEADLPLFNVCADAIVNSTLAHLGWLQLPPDAVRLDKLLAGALAQAQDEEAALLEWDVERLYLAIDDRQAGGSGKTAGGADNGSREDARDGPRAARTRAWFRAGTSDLRPAPGSAGAPEDEAAAAREWHERLLRGHAGDGEQSMLRALIADLPRLRTPWEQALRVQLAHGLSHRPGLSWSRPARSWLANQGRTVGGRRLPWEPGTSASRPVPRLVVVVDVSGSIEPALMERFAGEIEAISRRLEAALVLVVGDERVLHVQTFEPGRSDLRGIAFHGGGGTDFTPLLEEAQRHRPDITVVLTDLQGPARFKPRCPVIWAVPDAHRHAAPPFGRLLVLQ